MSDKLFDKIGREIQPGDVLKVFHFIGARRQQHYMHKQALRYDDRGCLVISHLNRIDDSEPWELGKNFYCERADGRVMLDYEIVGSIDARFDERIKIDITRERVLELVKYDRMTGHFTWIVNRTFMKVGDRAGTVEGNGYRNLRFDGRLFRAHRVAWLIEYGEFPQMDIDHIDGNRDNNAIANLRLATRSQNQGNVGCRKDNRSGFKGVKKHKNKWQAKIQMNGKSRSLGYFDSPEDASNAYARAARSVFGEFARAK